MSVRPGVILTAAALGTLAIDQYTKTIVRSHLAMGESVPLLDGVFQFTHVRNAGAAFGLMPGQRSLFLLTTTVVLAAIALFWYRARPREWVVALALGLIVGGAIGNLIDRVVDHGVTDFLDFVLIGFPVFNVADSAVVVGVALLSVWLLFGEGREQEGGTSAPRDEEPIARGAEDASR